jgi:hypothetical protein
VPLGASVALAALLVAFFAWTGRPIYRHVEYNGAIEGLREVAAQVEPDAVLLLRGGAPTYGQARDVPDLLATPLRYTFGLNALVVKSRNPDAYADALAAQVRRWQAEGRSVYLVLSASGGDVVLPGFGLEQTGGFRLDLPEFEQLTDQKPRNVATLSLDFAIYRLSDGPPGQIATPQPPLHASDFAAQVRGFYLPEQPEQRARAQLPDAAPYAWTNGDALLRLPWRAAEMPDTLLLRVAGGQRPDHLGPARLCLALLPEYVPRSAATDEQAVAQGCLDVGNTPHTYRVPLDRRNLPDAPAGSWLLRLHNAAWVPAEQDPTQHDLRPVGVQFIELQAGQRPARHAP